MNYYFTSKPKKLIKIYDRMTARMSSLESSIQNEVLRIEEDAARRSARFNIYYLPHADSAENPQLTLKIDPPGYYTLTYYITIYPDDMSGNPQLTAWLTDADSIESGMKKWLPAIKYLKDGHHYLIRYEGHVSGSRPMIMNSILYSYGNEMKAFEKHARIEVVSFNFTQQPE